MWALPRFTEDLEHVVFANRPLETRPGPIQVIRTTVVKKFNSSSRDRRLSSRCLHDGEDSTVD